MLGLKLSAIRTRPVATRFLMAPDHLTVEQAISWAQKPAPSARPRPIYPCGITLRRQKRAVAQACAKLWKRIGVSDYYQTEMRNGVLNVWQIRQILREDKLKQEGKVMKHCVGSYVNSCSTGRTTIWSMTRKIFDSESKGARRVLTIEVLPNRRISQALGFRNRDPRKDEYEILKLWAAKERLTISRYIV